MSHAHPIPGVTVHVSFPAPTIHSAPDVLNSLWEARCALATLHAHAEARTLAGPEDLSDVSGTCALVLDRLDAVMQGLDDGAAEGRGAR